MCDEEIWPHAGVSEYKERASAAGMDIRAMELRPTGGML